MEQEINSTQDESSKFVEFLLLNKQLSESTMMVYMSYYNRKPDEITNDNVADFIQRYKYTYSCVGFMKAYLQFLKRKDIELPIRPKSSKRVRLIRKIEYRDLRAMIDMLLRKDFRKGLMVLFVYEGALRRSEISSIKLNSFNLTKWLEEPSTFCRVRVIGKGDKEREILISPETMVLLIEHLEAQYPNLQLTDIFSSSSRLFPKFDGKAVWRVIHDESTKLFGKNIRPHEIRHHRATELLEKGAKIEDIKEYLGHANLTTTQTYLHINPLRALRNIEVNLSSTKE